MFLWNTGGKLCFSSNNLFQNDHTKTYPGHIWCEHACRHLVVVCAGDCLSQRPINGGGELAPRGALERHPPDFHCQRSEMLAYTPSLFSSSFSLLSFFSNFVSSSPLLSSPVFPVSVAALFSLFLDHLSFRWHHSSQSLVITLSPLSFLQCGSASWWEG